MLWVLLGRSLVCLGGFNSIQGGSRLGVHFYAALDVEYAMPRTDALRNNATATLEELAGRAEFVDLVFQRKSMQAYVHALGLMLETRAGRRGGVVSGRGALK